MKSNIILQTKKIQCFSDSEILSFIQPAKLTEILQKDAHPFFQAYSIAHEGISHSKFVNAGNKIIQWTRDAIKSIGRVFRDGIKCFWKHNENNSTTDRRVIGEAVGFQEKEIDGKLNAVAIIYHPTEIRDEAKKYDICSHEAEWEFEEKDGKLYAVSCNEITGIAFDNSQNTKPAFSGAKRLAMIQCFDESSDEDLKTNNKDVSMPDSMTFNDVREFILSRNIQPSRIFEADDIKADKKFSGLFQVSENEKKLTTDLTNITKEKDNLSKQFEDLKKENLKFTSRDRLEKILKTDSIELTENEKKFVFETLDKNIDHTDDGLKKFLNSRRDDFKVFMQVTGKEDQLPEIQIQEKKKDKLDYSKSENNDFI